jgi:hypothetical protein
VLRNPLALLLCVFFGPIAIFFAQAIFTGKYDAEGGLFNNFLVYVFGGFGYFSSLLNDVVPDYELMRTFYPLAKILQAFGVLVDVPSQILEFRDVPFTTNVGTFLEPLLSDGGVGLVIVGAPLLIFLVDVFSFRAIASGTAYGLFMWANLVLIPVFSFFVPKFNSTYFYLFFLVYLFYSWCIARNQGVEMKGEA